MICRILRWALATLLLLTPAWANDKPLRLYLDADFTTSFQVGNAIGLGIRTALSEQNFQVAGTTFQLVDKNHKGNVDRSFRTMQAFLQDDRALAMFGGMHSPPYLTHKSFLNDNQVLTLLPWSAAGPITRAAAGQENWVFRLSVDDAKAGRFLANRAISVANCERVALLLIDTGWGRGNQPVITQALKEQGRPPVYVNLFDKAIGEPAARDLAKEVAAANADCAILLAQATEASYLSNAFKELNHPITILSHWAILGARYPQDVPHETREFIGLQILQSCGLRETTANNPTLARALSPFTGRLETLSDVSAPAGFVHGYDLTRIFIAAVEQAAQTKAWSGSITQKRAAIKHALEHLDQPVSGILKTYDRPYGPYDANNPDAHEALGAGDLCMGRYRRDGRLEHADR